MCENIYFLFQKNTQTENISTSKFIGTSLGTLFCLQKIKDRALCFSTKKSVVTAVF